MTAVVAVRLIEQAAKARTRRRDLSQAHRHGSRWHGRRWHAPLNECRPTEPGDLPLQDQSLDGRAGGSCRSAPRCRAKQGTVRKQAGLQGRAMNRGFDAAHPRRVSAAGTGGYWLGRHGSVMRATAPALRPTTSTAQARSGHLLPRPGRETSLVAEPQQTPDGRP